jgi:hypothetical protein
LRMNSRHSSPSDPQARSEVVTLHASSCSGHARESEGGVNPSRRRHREPARATTRNRLEQSGRVSRASYFLPPLLRCGRSPARLASSRSHDAHEHHSRGTSSDAGSFVRRVGVAVYAAAHAARRSRT